MLHVHRVKELVPLPNQVVLIFVREQLAQFSMVVIRIIFHSVCRSTKHHLPQLGLHATTVDKRCRNEDKPFQSLRVGGHEAVDEVAFPSFASFCRSVSGSRRYSLNWQWSIPAAIE